MQPQPVCRAHLLLLAVLLTAAARQPADAKLVDRPLVLPGTPPRRATGPVAAAAPVQRSGYLRIEGTQRRLFYWFFQARNVTTGAALTSAAVPLVAWFNGGPGCSSLFGLFFEHGPFTLTPSLALAPNPHTWAGAAHLLYVDQPIGTGWSYSAAPGDQSASMLDVATTVQAFLQAFYRAPQYAHLARARLYLAGESAAGHYLPSIAAHLLRAGPAVPLAGLLMGNPCVNAPAMYQSLPAYALQNRLITPALHRTISARLPACTLQAAVCAALDAGACQGAAEYCEREVVVATVQSEGSLLASRNIYNIKAACGPSCYADLDARLEAYLNANAAALGASPNATFKACAAAPFSALLHDFARSYDALVAALLDNGVPVMVVVGEDDFLCNHLGNKAWIDGLVWSAQAAWASAPNQTWAGGTFRRQGPLSFVRVRQAGHMVPLDQPARSLQLLRQWMAAGQPAPVPAPSRLAG